MEGYKVRQREVNLGKLNKITYTGCKVYQGKPVMALKTNNEINTFKEV